jgi:hypothetical protein
LVNAQAITNGPAAQRGTYVGTICSNVSSTIDFQYASSVGGASGIAGFLHVWNMYNRVWVASGSISEDSASYTYTGSVAREANNSSTTRCWWITGQQEEAVYSWSYGDISSTSTMAGAPVGRGHARNSTTVTDAEELVYNVSVFKQDPCIETYHPFDMRIGLHYISLNEFSNGTDATQYRGDNSTNGVLLLSM